MVISISKKGKRFKEKRTIPTLCDASIPLSFITNISSGTIKKLASKASIVTLEELHTATDGDIRDHIKNRNMLKEVFDLREQIAKMVRLAQHRNILLFEEKAQNSNIKLRAHQRAQLIGVAIFANLCKDVAEVINYVLDTQTWLAFREKATLNRLANISEKTLNKRA